MTEQQIDEVMGLVEAQMEKINGGVLSTAQYVETDAIRAKLREVARRPMTNEEAESLWSNTPFPELPSGGVALIRASEKFHNIGTK